MNSSSAMKKRGLTSMTCLVVCGGFLASWMAWHARSDRREAAERDRRTPGALRVELNGGPAQGESAKAVLPKPAVPLAAQQNVRDVGPWHADFSKAGDVERELRLGNGALDANQELTSTAIRRLNLSPEQVAFINATLKETFASARELMRKNTASLPVLDSEQDVLGKFRITPDPEAGERLITQLHERMAEKTGAELAGKVINSLNFWGLYGGFGLLDGELTFTDTKIGIEPSTTVTTLQFEKRHPTTGHVLHSGTFPFNDLGKLFGRNAFSLDDSK